MAIESENASNNSSNDYVDNGDVEIYSTKPDNVDSTSDNQNDASNSFVSKKTIIFTLLLTVICVGSVFIGFKLFWFDKRVKDTNQMLKIENNSDHSNDYVKRPFRTIRKLATSSAQAKVLVLKNKPNEPIVDLDEMHVDGNCLDIAFWNDVVVIMESGNIVLTNIKTKDQRVIKTSEYLKDEFSCYFQHDSKLNVINNKLFIGINSVKMIEGGLFVLSDSKQATPAAVLSAKTIISKTDEQLLVDCMLGQPNDINYGYGYCIVDPLSLSITPIIHSNRTRYIGRDNYKRLLFVGQTKNYTTKYIIAVPNGKWDSYEGLIAEENIPIGYSTYTNGYSSVSNSVVFPGDGILLLNLDSQEPTTIVYPDGYKASSSGQYSPDIYVSSDNIFCINYGEFEGSHRYAYNPDTKYFVDYQKYCTKQRKIGIDKITEKLPVDYKITTLEVPKKIFDIKEIPLTDPLPNGWEEVKQ